MRLSPVTYISKTYVPLKLVSGLGGWGGGAGYNSHSVTKL